MRAATAAAVVVLTYACAAHASGDSTPLAESTASTTALPAPAQPPPCCRVQAGTVVALALVDDLSSKTQKPGDRFRLRLAAPITVDGHTVVAAGAAGVGEVIDAAPGGMGGRGGKLVLAARYLESNGQRLPLQSFKVGVGGGKDYSTESLITSEVVGPFALAVHGGNVDWPAGTPATAKLSADVMAPAADSHANNEGTAP